MAGSTAVGLCATCEYTVLWRPIWACAFKDEEEVLITVDQLVVWIVVGGIAGIFADVLIKGIRLDLVGRVVVGILGAFIGGWLFDALEISVGSGLISDVITAIAGAVVLLLVLRSIRRL